MGENNILTVQWKRTWNMTTTRGIIINLIHYFRLLKEPFCVSCGIVKKNCLGTLAADTSGKLDVLGHDSDTFGVDGAQVCVLEETDQVGLASLLESHDGRGLEAKISLKVLCNLSHETLEWQLADEQFCRFLVSTDLPQSHCSWPVTVRLLDAAGGGCALTSSLGGQLLAWGFASSGFTCCLLCTSHLSIMKSL